MNISSQETTVVAPLLKPDQVLPFIEFMEGRPEADKSLLYLLSDEDELETTGELFDKLERTHDSQSEPVKSRALAEIRGIQDQGDALVKELNNPGLSKSRRIRIERQSREASKSLNLARTERSDLPPKGLGFTALGSVELPEDIDGNDDAQVNAFAERLTELYMPRAFFALETDRNAVLERITAKLRDGGLGPIFAVVTPGGSISATTKSDFEWREYRRVHPGAGEPIKGNGQAAGVSRGHHISGGGLQVMSDTQWHGNLKGAPIRTQTTPTPRK